MSKGMQHVYGIGNAIADLLTQVSDDVFRDLKLKAGSFELFRKPEL